MVSALSSALKHKESVNCLQGNMGVPMQCRLKKHLMEEKVNPTKKKYHLIKSFLLATCCRLTQFSKL